MRLDRVFSTVTDAVIEAALSDVEGTMTLHEAPEGDGSSTLDAAAASDCAQVRGIRFTDREVDVITLSRVCGKLGDPSSANRKAMEFEPITA